MRTLLTDPFVPSLFASETDTIFVNTCLPGDVYVTAHRGFVNRYPKNTVRAVEKASEDADAVKIDVRRCGSGELVVIHYDHIGPITNGHGDVNELSASELTSLTINESNECIPRLDTGPDAVPPDTDIKIELKETHLAEDVLEVIDAIENDVVISALDANVHVLWETRILNESVPLALDFSIRSKENLEIAELIGCTCANPHWWMVHAWPVSSQVIAEALRWRGVDGLIVKSPQDAPCYQLVDAPNKLMSDG